MRSAILILLILFVSDIGARAATLTDIALQEEWRIGGSDDVILGSVVDVEADSADRIYILDGQLCRVLTISPEGELVGVVGREGEGPGEFRRPRSLILEPDGTIGVMMSMPGRVVRMSPKGEPLPDLPLPVPGDGSTLTLGGLELKGGNLVIYRFDRTFGAQTVDQNICLQRVGPGGVGGIRYHCMFVRDIPERMVMDETERGEVLQRWAVGPDGRVWFAEGYETYRLRVWHEDGTFDREFKRDFVPRRRSPEQLAAREDLIRSMIRNWPPNTQINISEFDLTIQSFRILPDGGCWVLTSRGLHDRPVGSLGVWDVFDAAGAYSGQVALIGEGDPARDTIHFVGDRILVVRGALDSRLAAAGGAVGAAAGEREQPVEVVCFGLADRR